MSTNSTIEPLISQLLVEDPDMRDLVEEFVDGLAIRIVELRTAFEQRDWAQLTTLAHRLKGAGGSYGYPNLGQVASDMETAAQLHVSDRFSDWISQLQQMAQAAKAGLSS